MAEPLIFRQLFEPESSTYTYLLADANTKEAVIIDPVLETVDRDVALIEELGLKLLYSLDTHVHADHITGSGEIRKRTGAKTCVSAEGHVECIDIPLEDGQELKFGSHTLRAIATPGHTNGCMSFYVGDRVFTGDALLIRGTGRTDFQQGSAETLYESLTKKLFTLPASTLVYPGHDYRGQTVSTIAEEMQHNPRVGGKRTKEQFVQIMKELKLANPKKIHEAVPANMACGLRRDTHRLQTRVVDGIPEVSPEEVHRTLGLIRIIDVRRPDEFTGELGHIPGATNIELGPKLEQFVESLDPADELVFVCRSGGRSGQATAYALERGRKFVHNMQGGMLRWNDLRFETQV